MQICETLERTKLFQISTFTELKSYDMLGMKKTIKIITLIIIICLNYNDKIYSDEVKDLEITISPTSESYDLLGPVSVRVTIKNISKSKLGVNFNYFTLGPRFSFQSENKDVDIPLRAYITTEYEEKMLDIGERFSFIMYLNKFMKFMKAGKYDIKYEVNYRYERCDNRAMSVTISDGILTIDLRKTEQKTLVKLFDSLSEQMDSSDLQTREEACSAFFDLDTPLAVKYLEKAANLSDSMCSERAVKALKRLNELKKETERSTK